jgi:hypothetical protein
MAQAGDLARLLQLRARAALAESEMPARIGSAELSVRGFMVAMRASDPQPAPRDRCAGGVEPGRKE